MPLVPCHETAKDPVWIPVEKYSHRTVRMYIATTAGVRIHLMSIVKEALNNIRKHAGAQNVAIVLLTGKDGLTITVEDDGKGFIGCQRSAADQKTTGSAGVGGERKDVQGNRQGAGAYRTDREVSYGETTGDFASGKPGAGYCLCRKKGVDRRGGNEGDLSPPLLFSPAIFSLYFLLFSFSTFAYVHDFFIDMKT